MERRHRQGGPLSGGYRTTITKRKNAGTTTLDRFIATLNRESRARLERELGQAIAARIRQREPTVSDLVVAAICMGINPVEIWPDATDGVRRHP